jgi:hypothetical protein
MTKKLLLLTIGLMPFTMLIQAQEYSNEYAEEEQVAETQILGSNPLKNTAISVGFMMGGGSLLGADFEYILPSTRFGLQVGLGISSIGGGLNYHLKDGANSSFVSLQYFHQGFGDNHIASWIGPMFIYRAKKLLQVGIGLGSLVDKGPVWYKLDEKQQEVSASLLYSIGLYF